MSYTLYFAIRQILMGVLLFLGLNMMFVKLPKRVILTNYQLSLRLMGIAFMLVPLSCFLYTKQNQLDLEPYVSTIISLTAYFSTFVLMSMSFLTILGKKISKVLMRVCLASIIIYPIPLWISLIIGKQEIISIVLTISYSYFVVVVVFFVLFILSKYKNIISDTDSSDSQDIFLGINWISKSILILIGLTVVCVFAPIFFIYPLWLRFIFMLYGVLSYVYIYYGYRKMLINITEYTLINKVSDSSELIQNQSRAFATALSAEVVAQIEISLSVWIQNKGYTKKGLTIDSVAKELKTNRTYLSRYINASYASTFRNWISNLRLEQARILLLEHPEMSINKIADTIGSASVESFTHIFTRLEGVSPTKWREENLYNTNLRN